MFQDTVVTPQQLQIKELVDTILGSEETDTKVQILGLINTFAQRTPSTHPHQDAPTVTNENILWLVKGGMAIMACYQSPAFFTAYSTSILLANALSPFMAKVNSQICGNLALICAELTTDYGPFTLGDEQMEYLLEQYGMAAYLIPPLTLLLWTKGPDFLEKLDQSPLGKTGHEFWEIMHGNTEPADIDDFKNDWMMQDGRELGENLIEGVKKGLKWLFTSKTAPVPKPSPVEKQASWWDDAYCPTPPATVTTPQASWWDTANIPEHYKPKP